MLVIVIVFTALVPSAAPVALFSVTLKFSLASTVVSSVIATVNDFGPASPSTQLHVPLLEV